ncbi:hypothetical protein CPLU01_00084 [Colletotrichum plurivorum]|uniref:Uncharacterized protein n=1 Tax=Colletotrichum plurivorum TaxID=2175906 RepID=A0A8H6U6F0_9PEZI|nr:hypothetical protein CPLU01_00084 [Colletotrichum plurivorum]
MGALQQARFAIPCFLPVPLLPLIWVGTVA